MNHVDLDVGGDMFRNRYPADFPSYQPWLGDGVGADDGFARQLERPPRQPDGGFGGEGKGGKNRKGRGRGQGPPSGGYDDADPGLGPGMADLMFAMPGLAGFPPGNPPMPTGMPNMRPPNMLNGNAPPPPEWANTTTVMMRNLPNKYTQRMLLTEINQTGFLGTFDFLYLPIDPETNANRGYSFLNFIDSSFAWMFKVSYEGRKMNRFNSSKVVSIVAATLQGFEANYAHYASARVNRGDPAARPLFLREPKQPLPNTSMGTAASGQGQNDGAKRGGRRRGGGGNMDGQPMPMQPNPQPQQSRMGAYLNVDEPAGLHHSPYPQDGLPEPIPHAPPGGSGGGGCGGGGGGGGPSMIPKFCPHCGGAIQPKFQFCPQCGASQDFSMMQGLNDDE